METEAAANTTYKRLNSNILKIIAIIAMTSDHLAWAIWQGFSTNPAAVIMHLLGRLTCPIMCYFVAEGYYYTKNLKKYIGRMFLFAAISHFPYVFCSFNYIDPLSFISTRCLLFRLLTVRHSIKQAFYGLSLGDWF